MSTKKRSKINQLLQSQPSGVVFLSSWLIKQGYSHDLLRKYRESNWLTPIGSGAMIRTGEEVEYQGALNTLQEQSGLSVHLGGRTALSLLGRAQYMAEKANHNWFNYIDITKIDLGSGKRALLKDGVYIPKYNITVPKELETSGNKKSI